MLRGAFTLLIKFSTYLSKKKKYTGSIHERLQMNRKPEPPNPKPYNPSSSKPTKQQSS
jgi:hypothetical protein